MDLRATDTVLITGANGGLGAAMARAVRATGATVVLTGRRADALEPLARELSARVVVTDLATHEGVARLHAEVPTVDAAVLNAGMPGSGSVLDIEAHEIDRVLDVNLRAPMRSAHFYGREMAARGRGHIVFISSIAGKVSAGGSSLYSATKFGLRGFSFGLREDLRESGVGVTTIFPGFIRDAGMFAASGVSLPRILGTRSPEDCAAALLAAIKENPAELDVASFEQRVGGWLFPLSPNFVSWLQRRGGAANITAKMRASKRKRDEVGA